MAATYTEATTARTAEQIKTAILDDLAARGVDANGFHDYSVERALPEIEATALASEEALRVAIVKAGALDPAATLSDPAWLRRLAKSVFRIDWNPARKALRSCRLTNTASGGPYTFDPRTLRASTASGTTFQSTDGGTLLATPGAILEPITFECDTAGTIGNAAPISKLITQFPGVTITDLGLVTAGTDDESNTLLIQRCDGRWGTIGKGGLSSAAIYNAIAAAPTITRVFIRDDNPFGPGTSGIYLANASGPATVDEVAAVNSDLAGRKQLGVPLPIAFAAPAHIVQVTATLYLDGSNANAATDAAAALQALASVFQGSILYSELIRSVLMGAAFPLLGLAGFRGVINVSLALPAGDTVLSSGEVLQITSTLGVL